MRDVLLSALPSVISSGDLIRASKEGDVDRVKALLAAGADTEEKDEVGV